ncbi:MAG TPA: hypothetical protein VFJ64_10855 [Solirubrobacterales bacterium]|nr:hypothetical protein [Solirubrobacterales bacterium]
MPTTVRNLTEAEQTTLRPILEELHAHVEKCEACKFAMDQSQRCDEGRKLYARWEDWLAQ